MPAFVVQRPDCLRLLLSRADPVYRAGVQRAMRQGVQLRAAAVRWDSQGQSAYLHRWLAVLP